MPFLQRFPIFLDSTYPRFKASLGAADVKHKRHAADTFALVTLESLPIYTAIKIPQQKRDQKVKDIAAIKGNFSFSFQLVFTDGERKIGPSGVATRIPL